MLKPTPWLGAQPSALCLGDCVAAPQKALSIWNTISWDMQTYGWCARGPDITDPRSFSGELVCWYKLWAGSGALVQTDSWRCTPKLPPQSGHSPPATLKNPNPTLAHFPAEWPTY